RMMQQQAEAQAQEQAAAGKNSESEFAQKKQLEEMKQAGKNGQPIGKENGKVTDKGVANALRAEIEEAGMDPKQFAQAN
ncbi:MAG: hypothetical protein M3Q73_04375, partial [bacterium]|nr:hypothetical protein [bacterium]